MIMTLTPRIFTQITREHGNDEEWPQDDESLPMTSRSRRLVKNHPVIVIQEELRPVP